VSVSSPGFEEGQFGADPGAERFSGTAGVTPWRRRWASVALLCDDEDVAGVARVGDAPLGLVEDRLA
jgi:hypothetical protein